MLASDIHMTTTPAVSDTYAPRSADAEPVRLPLRDAPQAAPIDPAALEATLAWIKTKPDEGKWASIPWQTDLWEARRLAAAQGKPIFAWMMNGNPLGCV
jgi:hypothetical protein